MPSFLFSYNFNSVYILTLESISGKLLAGVNNHKHCDAEFVQTNSWWASFMSSSLWNTETKQWTKPFGADILVKGIDKQMDILTSGKNNYYEKTENKVKGWSDI